MFKFVASWLVLVLLCCHEIHMIYAVDPLIKSVIPTYFIDPFILGILQPRTSCLRGGSAAAELEFVRQENAAEYFRSHELLAYSFFVEDAHINPHYRTSSKDAELEFIPLLPLAWNPRRFGHCSYVAIIRQLLRIHDYLQKRDHNAKSIKPKFTVAGTYNFRTQLGTGMPTQVRRGDAWTAIMDLIMSLSLGHYERWPQCPDLLRKSWKYIVELPYISVGSKIDIVRKANTSITVLNADASQGSTRSNKSLSRRLQQLTASAVSAAAGATSSSLTRKFTFLFAGNFELYGPELTCSVRNAIININGRTDAIVVNATLAASRSPVEVDDFIALLHHSIFCLVSKGDSYSTSFFYHAIEHGCIPVVISDWFTFAFPWLVPYESFVIRINEGDFIQNPDFVLDFLKDLTITKKDLITEMKSKMSQYRKLLSYEKMLYGSKEYHSLMSSDVFIAASQPSSGTPDDATFETHSSAVFHTLLPFELMMLELRYAQQPHRYYNNIPCFRPYMCMNDRRNQSEYTVKDDYTFYSRMARKKSFSKTYKKRSTVGDRKNQQQQQQLVDSTAGQFAHAYDLVDAGYQVNPIMFPKFEDRRSHLCRHNTRLIGSYKIVFFMQCVRILWPLQPGKFKPVDRADRWPELGTDAYTKLLETGLSMNSTTSVGNSKYAIDPDGISLFDRDYVRYFHSFSRPPGWYPYHHPITSDRSGIKPSLREARLHLM